MAKLTWDSDLADNELKDNYANMSTEELDEIISGMLSSANTDQKCLLFATQEIDKRVEVKSEV